MLSLTPLGYSSEVVKTGTVWMGSCTLFNKPPWQCYVLNSAMLVQAMWLPADMSVLSDEGREESLLWIY